VAGWADTTVVAVNPGWGDAVQANKAGLLEVADLLVVNKADRPGASEAERDLRTMLDMNLDPGPWRPPVVRTVATTGDGVEELWDAVSAHRSFLEESGLLAERRARRLDEEVRDIVLHHLAVQAEQRLSGPRYDQVTADLAARRSDPWSAAEALLADDA
ncbi:MAG: methylmalonyl Co-A mutase-associated GTPase MeaB, partial [Acidimicrobiia bacterium]